MPFVFGEVSLAVAETPFAFLRRADMNKRSREKRNADEVLADVEERHSTA